MCERPRDHYMTSDCRTIVEGWSAFENVRSGQITSWNFYATTFLQNQPKWPESEPLPEKFQEGEFTIVQACLTFWNFDKTLLIHNVSYFNIMGLGVLFGGAKPTKAPPHGIGLNILVYSTFQISPHHTMTRNRCIHNLKIVFSSSESWKL